MTDKEAVLDALSRLPENASSIEEITEELQIHGSSSRGREAIAAGRTKSQEEVKQLVDSWATGWGSDNLVRSGSRGSRRHLFLHCAR